ncbi:cortical protein marker for cell polarity-domain-containing protein [Flagelloscypha sp. PMI_526]|nr:cortical protein marker for cell polarity-domain-containing protein [Flagelloscypha sp. PMI_526]
MKSLSAAIIASLAHGSLAAFPQVDFERMGTVGLAGAFAGLDLFQSSAAPFDATTSTLFARSPLGALTRLASTNQGGSIVAGCALDQVFYFAGSFSSVGDLTTPNIASYDNSSAKFAALGSGGPNGPVNALWCDQKNAKVWAGGSFSSPGSNVALWDPKAGSWSKAPFSGVSGAGAHVFSITSNSSASSVFIAGSFLTSFRGNGANLTGSNNPNVPFSAGATPFSSSLVPVPLDNAEVVGSPSTSDTQFNNAKAILCPAGDDGPGNTWLAADGNEAKLTLRKFSFISVAGVRLGNTFVANHGTTAFSVTTIPDNTLRTLTYLDPTSNTNKTCSDPCPLSTDKSLLYQDFLFDAPQSITGVEIKLSKFTGAGSGLHIAQLLSSGAFAASVDTENGQSCFSPAASNSSRNGDWSVKVANTGISGTTQSVLVSSVNVGTSPADGPSFTWRPYVSASGTYEIRLRVPGCTNFQDCDARTSVKVAVFPGNGLDPVITTVSQRNTDDATPVIYNGPILPAADFTAVVTMTLADQPEGSGSGGKYELVADRVQFDLTSANLTSSSDSAGSGNGTLAQGNKSSFGFLEWPLDTSVTGDATQVLPNSTQTDLDNLGISLSSAVGGTTSLSSTSNTGIATVAHHPSGAIFIGGNFTLSSGTASGSANVVSWKSNGFAGMAGNGLNGPVTSFALFGDKLFVGGAFTDTKSGTMGGTLRGIALYDVQQNTWAALEAGVDGAVTSVGILNGQVQITGNFTKLLHSANNNAGSDVAGLASWNIQTNAWAPSGGFIVGSMTMVANSTQAQFVAGNVRSHQKFGSSGMVYLKNGDDNGPSVTPLGVQLESSGSTTQASLAVKRSIHHIPRAASWFAHLRSTILARQSSSITAALPPPPQGEAPAVFAGAFWTNSSAKNSEMTVIGGNFSFLATGSNSFAQGVAVYNPDASTITALQGSQVNGTVRSLLVDGSLLYIGGQFTIQGTDANGFAIYDLAQQQWSMTGVQALQATAGSSVLVRSISKSNAKANSIIVAGSFAKAGSLGCNAICLLDISSKQWNPLGGGIQGEVSTVGYSGNNQDNLVAAGSLALSDNTAANVAQFVFANSSWSAVGSDLPGPVTALEVNNLNGSSIFAAGRSTDGSSTFLNFWNGAQWSTLGSNFEKDTVVSQLAMVPLSKDHSANGIIEANRMLMVSGSLAISSFGNASTALFDGTIAALFHSFTFFSFDRRSQIPRRLIYVLWTLFSRRDDRLKLDGMEDDDDSTHHRPSSLLEHINAATRTTILGSTAFGAAGRYSPEPEEEKHHRHSSPLTPEPDPFGADAGGFARAETPSDALGGLGPEESGRPAHVRYSFDGTGEGELAISAGTELEVLDDRDPAWWYARDVRTGREGVVPAAYLY